jgi:CHAD domain-containing protein
MTISLQLKFPADLTLEQLMNQLDNDIDYQCVSTRHHLTTYYDSFDWRLYSSGMVYEFTPPTLTLKAVKNNAAIASTKLQKVPAFSHQFKPDKVSSTLEPILEMRALLPVCTSAYKRHQFNIINEDKKTVVRLFIEEHEHIAHRVFLQPLKGYDSAAESLTKRLIALGLTATTKPVLLDVLKQQGLTINDYSSKLAISLTADMRADIACKIIYSCLLKTMKDNEQGTIADTDSEFLHDFRVAVRRTRASLSQLKNVLPDNIYGNAVDFFSWLGKITSPTRDLDVYLLNFAQYKNSLPLAMREDLNPLHGFLLKKQRQTQQELVKNLHSDKYHTMLSTWERYLASPVQMHPKANNAQLSIKQLADKRIRKIFKRVLSEGKAINDESPAEDLHELRKSCKKLRYLMEFFQSLYDKDRIKALIKALKGLQEVLGDFQDCAVQECSLKHFSEEMRTLNTPTDTFLAIGSLIANIDTRKYEIRSHFAEKFAEFTEEDTVATFKLLFNN